MSILVFPLADCSRGHLTSSKWAHTMAKTGCVMLTLLQLTNTLVNVSRSMIAREGVLE